MVFFFQEDANLVTHFIRTHTTVHCYFHFTGEDLFHRFHNRYMYCSIKTSLEGCRSKCVISAFLLHGLQKKRYPLLTSFTEFVTEKKKKKKAYDTPFVTFLSLCKKIQLVNCKLIPLNSSFIALQYKIPNWCCLNFS